MKETDLKTGRGNKGWTQHQAALRLGVSQPYLSLLEKGARQVPKKLARKASTVYGLAATTLPLETGEHSVHPKPNEALASELAALGYPGLAMLAGLPLGPSRFDPNLDLVAARDRRNFVLDQMQQLGTATPAEVTAAKVNDLQNKLGFITNVARRLAEKLGKTEITALLREYESALERSRLVQEETLCHDSLTQAERRWLRSNRSAQAKHWNLLTDLSPEHLSHAL